MVSLDVLKEFPLTSQEIYDIINNAIDAANDEGFLSSFVFCRAFNCYLALALVDEDEIEDWMYPALQENPVSAWDSFMKNGLLDKVAAAYQDECRVLADIAGEYFEEYQAYSLSLGGSVNRAVDVLNNYLEKTLDGYKNLVQNADVQDALRIAEEWGMNRKNPGTDNLSLV